MKFEVFRSSNILPTLTDKPPCEGATLVSDVQFPYWTIEIESLEALIAFCEKNGKVVIEPDKPLPTLEIYDTWRE